MGTLLSDQVFPKPRTILRLKLESLRYKLYKWEVQKQNLDGPKKILNKKVLWSKH